MLAFNGNRSYVSNVKLTVKFYKAFLLTITLIALVSCLSYCETIIRNVEPLRSWAYPPQVENMKGLTPDTTGTRFDHQVYTELLEKIVNKQGLVDYGKLYKIENDKELLSQYLNQIKKANFKSLSHHSQFALLINAYNACTLDLMLDYRGVSSIKDIPSEKRWKAKRCNIGGRLVSLDYLEHKWMRPTYQDPRIHFAVVCAAKDCPLLRNEAYTGDKLTAQLRDQTNIFFQRDKYFEYKNGTVYLSRLLDWYRGDFASFAGSLSNYIRSHVPKSLKKKLPEKGSLNIEWKKYSWSLNGSW